jgi:hypothetical protein
MPVGAACQVNPPINTLIFWPRSCPSGGAKERGSTPLGGCAPQVRTAKTQSRPISSTLNFSTTYLQRPRAPPATRASRAAPGVDQRIPLNPTIRAHPSPRRRRTAVRRTAVRRMATMVPSCAKSRGSCGSPSRAPARCARSWTGWSVASATSSWSSRPCPAAPCPTGSRLETQAHPPPTHMAHRHVTPGVPPPLSRPHCASPRCPRRSCRSEPWTPKRLPRTPAAPRPW